MRKSKKKRSQPSPKSKDRSKNKGVNEKVTKKKGIEFFNNSNYHAALIEWQKAGLADDKWQKIIAETHFRKGLEAYRQKETKPDVLYNQIISAMSQAVKLQPNNGLYHYHLGLAYEHLGNLKKATSCYQKAIEKTGEQRYILQLVLVYLKRNMIAEAKQYAEFITDETNHSMFDLLLKLKASETKQAAATNLPTQADDHSFIRGLVALQQNEPEVALSIFKAQNKLHLKKSYFKAIILYFEGVALLQQDNPEKAGKKFISAFEMGLRGDYFIANIAVALWKKSMEYTEKRNLSAALRSFEAIHTLTPESETLQNNINLIKFHHANELARHEKYENAIKLWQACTLKGDMNSYHNIAVAYDRLDESKAATSHWLELIKYWRLQFRRHPDQSQLKDNLIIVHKRLADNYLKNNDYNRAAKEFAEVLRYTPNAVETLLKLGELYIDMEKWTSAQKTFQKILVIQPEHVDTLLNLAFVYGMEYETQPALRILHRVLDLEPGNREAIKQLQELYHSEAHYYWEEEEDIKTAVDFFEKEIRLAPDRFNGYDCLADLYHEYGQANKTKDLFTQYIRSRPQDPFAYFNVGFHYLEHNSRKTAQNFFRQTEELAPQNAELLFEIGSAYLHNFIVNKAVSYFSKAAKSEPKNSELLALIGISLAEVRPTKAIFYLKKSLKLKPDNKPVSEMLSVLHLIAGNEAEIQKEMSRMSQIAGMQENETEIDEAEKIDKNQIELF